MSGITRNILADLAKKGITGKEAQTKLKEMQATEKGTCTEEKEESQ